MSKEVIFKVKLCGLCNSVLCGTHRRNRDGATVNINLERLIERQPCPYKCDSKCNHSFYSIFYRTRDGIRVIVDEDKREVISADTYNGMQDNNVSLTGYFPRKRELELEQSILRERAGRQPHLALWYQPSVPFLDPMFSTVGPYGLQAADPAAMQWIVPA